MDPTNPAEVLASLARPFVSSAVATIAVKDGQDEEEWAATKSDLDLAANIRRSLGSREADRVRALQKLHEGTYGVCDICKTKINPERMECNPAAVLCVPCKKEQELRGGLCGHFPVGVHVRYRR